MTPSIQWQVVPIEFCLYSSPRRTSSCGPSECPLPALNPQQEYQKESPQAQGHAHLNLPYNPNLDNILNGIQGGVIATLLDVAGWFAVAAQNEGVWTTTSELSIHFLHPAKECELHTEGWVVKSGKRISVAQMRVSGPNEELVAIGTGTYVVLETVPSKGNAP